VTTGQFDALARSLATVMTRYRIVRMLAASTSGALLGRTRVMQVQAASQCRPPGAGCRRNSQCCAKVCLDNKLCGCFSQETGSIPCPTGCRCDQVSPGAVGACVEDINVESCCASLPRCASNKNCGKVAFCDQTICTGGLCMRRCGF
jgi:hypothetical protein